MTLEKSLDEQFAEEAFATELWKRPPDLLEGLKALGKQKKFEEIKSMALKFLLATAHRNNKEEVTIFGEIPEIWEFAEEFYEYAKEKEGEK